MPFKMKYEVKADYIAKGKRRPGTFITPNFGVLHDTGNPGSTAQNNRNYFNNTPNDPTAASAHTFIDDHNIIESVPATTGKAERAHHVRYQMTQDNVMFGNDANDIAIGVELCFGGKIDFEEAYKRYVWYCAYVSYKFGFSPKRWVGHEKLDPGRKTDPTNALKRYGKSYEQLLADIVKEYAECTIPEVKAVVDSADGKLTRGESGPNVKILIDMLRELEHTRIVGDVFNGYIETALKEFQKAHGLPVDGIYTSVVGTKMVEAIKSKKAAEESDDIYRVQFGAFSNKENAEKLVDKAKESGFDAIITKEER